MKEHIHIANKALQKLGICRISNFEEGSEASENCKLALPFVLRSLLRGFDWGFATTSTILPRLKDQKHGRYMFRLPADCVSVLSVRDNPDWDLEGIYLYSCSQDPMKISYIHVVANPNDWDALFTECVVLKLAVDLCDKLVESDTKKNLLLGELDRKIKEAKDRSCSGNKPINI